MNKLYKTLSILLLSAFTMLFGNSAFAAPPDFTTLTDAVDFSTTQTALLAVMAALAVVFILIRGGGLILSKIRR